MEDTERSTAINSEDQSSKIPRWLGIAAALALLGALVGVIVYGYLATPGWVGVADKKFWDYLELLIVPAILAIGAFWLNVAQRTREQRNQTAQRELQEYIENQRIQDGALEAYLDQMAKLVMDHNFQDQYAAKPRSIARARTLTVLVRLDGSRKSHIVRFWYRLKAITSTRVNPERFHPEPFGEENIDSIEDFHNYIDSRHAYGDIPLDLRDADLSIVDLCGAKLAGVILFFTDLQEADFQGADLRGASLQGADLRGANLQGADLEGANLRWATVTPTQLHAASSLLGATMPTGQKYEDWLKGKGREEDG